MARIIAKQVGDHLFTKIPYGSRGTSIALLVERDPNRDRCKVRRWRQGPDRWGKARWVATADCEDPGADPRIPEALRSLAAELKE